MARGTGAEAGSAQAGTRGGQTRAIGYHVYPAHAEATLRAEGLRPGFHGREEGDGRVYLFCDRDEARWYAQMQTEDAASEGFRDPDGDAIRMRIVPVDLTGLVCEKDWTLLSADEENAQSSAVWTVGPVGPERIDPVLDEDTPDPVSRARATTITSAEGYRLVEAVPSETVGIRAQHDEAGLVSETLGDQRWPTRDDGFFGTGAYFGSTAEAIGDLVELRSWANPDVTRATGRGLVGLDLSAARLLRPETKKDAWELHDWLGHLNYEVIADIRSPDPYDVLSRALGRSAKELPLRLRLRAHVDHLPAALTGADVNTALLGELVDEARADLAAERYETDSLSTRLLRRLGFDGVDVRHLPELDNSRYGSVLFRPL